MSRKKAKSWNMTEHQIKRLQKKFANLAKIAEKAKKKKRKPVKSNRKYSGLCDAIHNNNSIGGKSLGWTQ